jgi:hypothetical protein
MPRWRNGRRDGLKIRSAAMSVPVRVRPEANLLSFSRIGLIRIGLTRIDLCNERSLIRRIRLKRTQQETFSHEWVGLWHGWVFHPLIKLKRMRLKIAFNALAFAIFSICKFFTSKLFLCDFHIQDTTFGLPIANGPGKIFNGRRQRIRFLTPSVRDRKKRA